MEEWSVYTLPPTAAQIQIVSAFCSGSCSTAPGRAPVSQQTLWWVKITPLSFFFLMDWKQERTRQVADGGEGEAREGQFESVSVYSASSQGPRDWVLLCQM